MSSLESSPLRAAVIGAGVMGRQHLRVYQGLDEAELVAVADPDPEVLRRATRGLTARAYLDYRAMLDREDLDVVSVVVPTSEHRRVALDVIERGLGLLVEKPIAASCKEAGEIVEAAERAHVPLAVGHIERFNPAVRELRRQLAAGTLGRLYQIKALRVGPFPGRILDVGVTVDLATHDIDLMLKLVGAAVERAHAETTSNIESTHEDLLSAVLRFADGTVGALDVNWLTPKKVRELTVVGERGVFVVNYLTQELFLYEDGVPHNGWDHLDVLGANLGQTLRMRTDPVEPLQAELASFVQSVRAGVEPEVTGWDGLSALAVAEAIIQSAAAGSPVSPQAPGLLAVRDGGTATRRAP